MVQHNLSKGFTRTVSARYEIRRPSEDGERRNYQRFLLERYLALALIRVSDELYARGKHDHTMRDLYTVASTIAHAMKDGTARGYAPGIVFLNIEQQSLRERITLPQLLRSMPPSWHQSATVIVERSGLFTLLEGGVPGFSSASYRWTYRCVQEYLATLGDVSFGLHTDVSTIDHFDDSALFVREAERLYCAKSICEQR